MLRLLMLLLLIAACVAGFGLYRGWFRVASDHSGENPNVTITVDKDKMHQDQQRAAQAARDSVNATKQAVKPAAPATSGG